jgi:protein SCO1/2
MTRPNSRRLLLLGLCAAALRPALAAEVPAPLPGDITTDPRPVPRWLLQRASDGRTLMPESLQGRFQLVAFGFVSCPDVCPTTMAEMKAVLDRLGPRADKLQALFISVDPERDTLAVLREYTAAFDRRIIGLTGPMALVERAAQSFKVRFEKVPSPGGDAKAYTVDHTAGMFLVGPDGQLLSRLAYGMTVAELTARIERWMNAAE